MGRIATGVVEKKGAPPVMKRTKPALTIVGKAMAKAMKDVAEEPKRGRGRPSDPKITRARVMEHWEKMRTEIERSIFAAIPAKASDARGHVIRTVSRVAGMASRRK